ncbi:MULTISPECIES: elongation factor P 5-aminopentanone reductase [Bacillus]|uniref:elongation factor P 5-aminopentanone reductase n=1 Tax=Bacillus TaxID=1386 RepID=UPI000BB6797C|nr:MULTISPECIES: SDR family oxidoreductase [Bacillus]
MKNRALIIGASGGIGKAISEQLIHDGYFTYLHYNNDEKTVNQMVNQYGQEKVRPVQADLSSYDGVEKLKAQINTPIDTIVYNAGTTFYGLITDISKADRDKMIQLNITSLYETIQTLLPSMIQKKSGNIVVVSSVWGQVGASCEVLYSMTKGGQIAFVKALAKEVALSGIRVNAVAPGAVHTKMVEHFTQEELLQLAEDIPLGRLAQSKEIADAVSFLLSDRASYITGEIMNVNGGWF